MILGHLDLHTFKLLIKRDLFLIDIAALEGSSEPLDLFVGSSHV